MALRAPLAPPRTRIWPVRGAARRRPPVALQSVPARPLLLFVLVGDLLLTLVGERSRRPGPAPGLGGKGHGTTPEIPHSGRAGPTAARRARPVTGPRADPGPAGRVPARRGAPAAADRGRLGHRRPGGRGRAGRRQADVRVAVRRPQRGGRAGRGDPPG